MKSEKFIWTGVEGVARNGKTLKPGLTYAAADFPAHVVAEWIKTGNAKPVTAAAVSKSETPLKGNQ